MEIESDIRESLAALLSETGVDDVAERLNISGTGNITIVACGNSRISLHATRSNASKKKDTP